jgi:hypothetical protein
MIVKSKGKVWEKEKKMMNRKWRMVIEFRD